MDTEAILRELRPLLDSGWIGQGPVVERFEAACAKYVGAKHFVATSSGTAALHLAVHCLDLPKGSRVLTTPITFVSTNAALLYCGLVPVFGHTRYGMLDGPPHSPETISDCAAVISVSLGGQEPIPANIEDCSHAFGAAWLHTAPDPYMRTYSFHAVKNLPMGDGGGISTNDAALAARLRRLRWLGIDKSTHQRSQGRYVTDYDIPELGWKYHMNDITAAVGLAMLPRVAEQNELRHKIAIRYCLAVLDISRHAPGWIQPPSEYIHFFPLFFENRAEIEALCQERGIGYSRHYKPNYHYPAFAGCPCPGRESAEWYWEHALVLPMFPSMTDEEIERVCAVIQKGRFSE
jgi:perosamine synthetase